MIGYLVHVQYNTTQVMLNIEYNILIKIKT